MGIVFLGSMIVVIVIFMVEILIVHYNYQYHSHFPSYYPCPSPFFSHSFFKIYMVVVVSWWGKQSLVDVAVVILGMAAH